MHIIIVVFTAYIIYVLNLTVKKMIIMMEESIVVLAELHLTPGQVKVVSNSQRHIMTKIKTCTHN